jgi:uncharacterized protein (TIGR02001 family)
MKKIVILSALASLFAVSVHAEDAAPAVATNFSLTSNYKYRGQDQGNNKPAVQGGFDYANSGFYVGNWNSSIGFTNSGIEMDFYGGYKGEITKDLGFDVGVLQYYYSQKDKVTDYNTTELYGALSYGPVSLKYSTTVSKDYFGFGEFYGQQTGLPAPKGRNTGYLDLSGNFEIAKGLTLNAHMGFTRLSSELKDVGYENYADYKFGATMDLGSGFSGGAAIVGATKKDFYGDVNKARAILTITKSM